MMKKPKILWEQPEGKYRLALKWTAQSDDVYMLESSLGCADAMGQKKWDEKSMDELPIQFFRDTFPQTDS